jgi:HPt (histidine-containing phosphotransfer) domain-containing protein
LILNFICRERAGVSEKLSTPIDLDHLARMTCGETALQREVLGMFLAQSGRLISALADASAKVATISHTLKGSAKAVGAFDVAERAAAVEEAALKGSDPAPSLGELKAAVSKASDAIEALLKAPDRAA